jgi:hypothetical protein
MADHPANLVLLSYLKAPACPPSGPDDHELDGWQLHTHPDLVERLTTLAPDGAPVIPLFGVPALAAENGVFATVALGTSWLIVRLPHLPDDLEIEKPIPPR